MLEASYNKGQQLNDSEVSNRAWLSSDLKGSKGKIEFDFKEEKLKASQLIWVYSHCNQVQVSAMGTQQGMRLRIHCSLIIGIYSYGASSFCYWSLSKQPIGR